MRLHNVELSGKGCSQWLLLSLLTVVWRVVAAGRTKPVQLSLLDMPQQSVVTQTAVGSLKQAFLSVFWTFFRRTFVVIFECVSVAIKQSHRGTGREKKY